MAKARRKRFPQFEQWDWAALTDKALKLGLQGRAKSRYVRVVSPAFYGFVAGIIRDGLTTVDRINVSHLRHLSHDESMKTQDALDALRNIADGQIPDRFYEHSCTFTDVVRDYAKHVIKGETT